MPTSVFSKLVEFVPPKLKNNSLGWHVEYYVLDPIGGNLIRKRFRLNFLYSKCSSKKEFYLRANQVLQEISSRLSSGWSPISEESSNRYYVSIFTAFDRFLLAKGKELRPDSMRTYKGIIKLLKDWLETPIYCVSFSAETALEFMDYCYHEREISNRTYNSYLKQCKVVFSWLESNLYIRENPFEKLKKKKEEEKIRDIIPANTRSLITDYLKVTCPGYLLVCELVFYSLLRPSEISRLQVKHLHLEDSLIQLSADITKSHCERTAALTDSMVIRFREFVGSLPSHYYLFGTGFQPSEKPLKIKSYQNQWVLVRQSLGLPESYQLYSLRDSGIVEKFRAGLDPVTIMQAAGHHDLSVTTVYADHFDKDLVLSLRKSSPNF